MDVFSSNVIWIIEDILVYLFALVFIVYVIKHEKHPEVAMIEMFAFVFLDAALYENLAAQYLGLYGYGRSLIMIGSVPLSIPIFEFLIVYLSLKLLGKMKVSTWIKPFVVGFFGMMADFSLDPVSVKQIFTTAGGTIGRWSWFFPATNVQIYGEPVYNFTGWVLICGYGAAFLLLGRYWFRKSNLRPLVGYVYPFLMMIAAFLLLVTPLSQFFLWLSPIYKVGELGEWIMLVFWIAFTLIMWLVNWKGKMRSPITFKEDYLVLFLIVGFPIINLVFTLVGGYQKILWLEVLVLIISIVFVIGFLLLSKKQFPKGSSQSHLSL
jgi:hypothetical protein